MLIVGAQGFAREVLEVVNQLNELKDLVFYDDVNKELPDKLYGRFPIHTSLEAASDYFTHTDRRFCLGLGNPFLRKKLYEKLKVPIGLINSSWGGTPAETWTPATVVTNDETTRLASMKISDAAWWPTKPGKTYNAMIAPLIPFNIAGVIWYQGVTMIFSAAFDQPHNLVSAFRCSTMLSASTEGSRMLAEPDAGNRMAQRRMKRVKALKVDIQLFVKIVKQSGDVQ